MMGISGLQEITCTKTKFKAAEFSPKF